MISIVIPSAGRAKENLTAIESAIIYVPESEYHDYRLNHPDREIITHTDSAYKNLAEKRQGIYEKFGSVFMVDDDVVSVERVYIQKSDGIPAKLTGPEIKTLIEATAETAKAAGCYLFGFNNAPNPRHFYAQKPISLTAYINACAFGLHACDNLYFTPRLIAAESHWINLLNAYTNRKVWCDQRFHFRQKKNSTFNLPGGQAAHRTLQTERADSLFLKRMFGAAVTIKKPKSDTPGVHQFQREIKNPL